LFYDPEVEACQIALKDKVMRDLTKVLEGFFNVQTENCSDKDFYSKFQVKFSLKTFGSRVFGGDALIIRH